MPTLTVRNIPDKLYTKLKKSADKNRRSINNEILVCIEKTLDSKEKSVDEIIARARELRKSIKANDISLDDMIKAKNEGRL